MKKFILILIASIGINFYLSAQSAGDYSSIGSGNWNDPTKWQIFNGSSWVSTTTYPGQTPGTGLVSIANETEIIITATVPNPVFSLFVYAEMACSCHNYNYAPLSKLIFSAESAISLTVTTGVTIYGELLIADQNGAKTHSIFIGGSLFFGDGEGRMGEYNYDHYQHPTVFQTINQDDKINVTFNTTVPNSIVTGYVLSFLDLRASFQDVTFNGIGITLETGILVRGHANFINGIVKSGFDGIRFGDGATYSGASVASYVEGGVSKQGNDAFTFPIGGGGIYSPLTISAPVGETEALTARYFRSSQSGLQTISDAELYNVSNCEFWTLARTSGSSINYNLDVTIAWTSASGCGLLPYVENVSAVTMAHLNPNFNVVSSSWTWDSHSGSGMGTTTNGSVTWYGVSNFGYFTLGNLNRGCITPTGLNATNLTTNSATLGWSGVSGSLSYDVDYKPPNTYYWTNAATAATSTSVNLSGLNSLVTYEWRVRARCSSSSSTYRVGQFTTLINTCNSPAGLTTSNITSGRATLNWDAVAGAVNYNVEYKPSVSASWITAVTGTTSLSYNLSGLSASTAYHWRVSADCSNYTQASFTTAPVCNDVYETNNSSSQARAISLGNTISAGISSAADVDWFKVTTPNNANTNLEVTLSNLPADYDLYVYNKSLKLVASSINSGTSNEVVIYNSNARKATYYVKVLGKNGIFNASYCYSLLAQLSSSPAGSVSNATVPQKEINEGLSKQMLYPNPASEFVYLNFNSATEGLVNIQIVNSIGQLVKQHPVNTIKGNNQIKMQVADIRPGMYILRINKGDLNLTRKFVIAR